MVLPKETFGIVLGLGIASSSLLVKDKPSRGSGSSGPFLAASFLENVLKRSRISRYTGMLYDWEVNRKVTSVATSAKDLSCLEEATLVFFEVVF